MAALAAAHYEENKPTTKRKSEDSDEDSDKEDEPRAAKRVCNSEETDEPTVVPAPPGCATRGGKVNYLLLVHRLTRPLCGLLDR